MRITGRTDKVWSHPYYEWERGGDISVGFEWDEDYTPQAKPWDEASAARYVADRLAESGWKDITISPNQ